MNKLVLMSRCEKVEQIDRDLWLITLPFKGFFRGVRIKKVKIECRGSHPELGIEVSVFVEWRYIRDEIIYGVMLNYRILDEMRTDLL